MFVRENQVAAIIVDTAYQIHRRYGPGLYEAAYGAVLAYELRKQGLKVEREKLMPLVHDGVRLEVAYRIDMLVEDLMVIELKSVDATSPAHRMQVLTYLRLANKRLGFLINFGAPTLKAGLQRVVNNLPEEPSGSP